MFSGNRCCPKCGSSARNRIHRGFWIRLLPFSRFYKCLDCSTHYMVFKIRDATPRVDGGGFTSKGER